jgi:hypothetical protein
MPKVYMCFFRSKECDILRGECVQTYVPYLFLVIPLGPVTLTGQDYVLVESGCVCRPKYGVHAPQTLDAYFQPALPTPSTNSSIKSLPWCSYYCEEHRKFLMEIWVVDLLAELFVNVRRSEWWTAALYSVDWCLAKVVTKVQFPTCVVVSSFALFTWCSRSEFGELIICIKFGAAMMVEVGTSVLRKKKETRSNPCLSRQTANQLVCVELFSGWLFLPSTNDCVVDQPSTKLLQSKLSVKIKNCMFQSFLSREALLKMKDIVCWKFGYDSLGPDIQWRIK